MAGRPKRRAKLAAQWAEVDRAAGRASNAGRPKRRARLAAAAAAAASAPVSDEGWVYPEGWGPMPPADPNLYSKTALPALPSSLTDLIETRDAADAQCRRAEKQFRQARYVHHAAERNDYIDESDRMDAEREYHNTVEALEDARRRLAEINKALAAARRTPNAGRPKRRARIAAQWAEVDRAAGVKVPRAKRKKNGGLPAGWRLYRWLQQGPFGDDNYELVSLEPDPVLGGHIVYFFWRSIFQEGSYRLEKQDVADLGPTNPRLGTEIAFEDADPNVQSWALRQIEAYGRSGLRSELDVGSRKKNGGLSSRWLVFKGGKRPSRAHSPYVLLSTQPEAGGKTRGTHLYCLIGGTGVDQWDACSYDSYDEDAREGFSWWGTQVSLDDVPEPYRSSILKRAGHYERMAAGGTPDASSAYASREERLAAMPSYRKRTQNAPFPDPRAKARKYEVVVGEMGTLYSSPSRTAAEIQFGNLARASDSHAMGLLAGSDVRLYCDGVVLAEHIGRLNSRHRGR